MSVLWFQVEFLIFVSVGQLGQYFYPFHMQPRKFPKEQDRALYSKQKLLVYVRRLWNIFEQMKFEIFNQSFYNEEQ